MSDRIAVGIVGVRNSTDDSSREAAGELETLRWYPTWRAPVRDDEMDAVVIGTWPYLAGG